MTKICRDFTEADFRRSVSGGKLWQITLPETQLHRSFTESIPIRFFSLAFLLVWYYRWIQSASIVQSKTFILQNEILSIIYSVVYLIATCWVSSWHDLKPSMGRSRAEHCPRANLSEDMSVLVSINEPALHQDILTYVFYELVRSTIRQRRNDLSWCKSNRRSSVAPRLPATRYIRHSFRE